METKDKNRFQLQWLKSVTYGISQGSTVSFLLLNIFINDVFLFVLESDICSSADDNTISWCVNVLSDISHNLKFNPGHVLKWFKVNFLKPNLDKFQSMILRTNTGIKVKLSLDGNKIEKSQEVVFSWNNYWW